MALPSDRDAGPGGLVIRKLCHKTSGHVHLRSIALCRTVPVSQQIIAVLLSLLGTVVVSATVLYAFENPDTNMEAAEAWLN